MDKDFLAQLDRQSNKTIYVRLISLNLDETPIEAIEGRATSGSINIDGASAIRRTCQISLVADELNISDYYWSLKTKFKVQIGVENTINHSPEIIWFDQGIFLITSFSTSYSTNSYTINISGKDKMCTLNGEMGGVINSGIALDTYDEIDKDGNIRKIKITLKQMIFDLVSHYGGEAVQNIIINDLDMSGMELLEYRYDTPMYLARKATEPTSYVQAYLDGEISVWIVKDGFTQKTKLADIPNYDTYGINGLIDGDQVAFSNSTDINKCYYIARIDYGEVAGYKEIDLIYPTELSANAGESVVSILDKIKNMLGDYEYFYDLDGRFIFQKKKTYLNTSWNSISTDSEGAIYVDPYFAATPYSYNFTDTTLFTAFNNTPNIANLKNDFTVWGTNKNDLPIHMRYAIDVKPTYYKSIKVLDSELEDYNAKYGLETKGQVSVIYWCGNETPANPDSLSIIECDWREILHQMQKDYYKYNHLDSYRQKVGDANPLHYPNGFTGYEQYYIDIQGFWRYLYTPIDEFQQKNNNSEWNEYYGGAKYQGSSDTEINVATKVIEFAEPASKIPPFEDGTMLGIKLKHGHSTQLLSIQINGTTKPVVAQNGASSIGQLSSGEYLLLCYNSKVNNNNGAWIRIDYPEDKAGWRKAVYEDPSKLVFWFDFLDSADSELGDYSVKKIGIRPKVENDKDARAIYYGDIPSIVFESDENDRPNQSGYVYFQVENGNFLSMFSRSTQGKSVKDSIDNLLYNYSYCTESVSITSIPIYYLEPNTLIHVSEPNAGIDGDYIISKLTIPLAYNGTMSITGTKVVPRLY